MNRDRFLMVRGIAIILVGLCINLILWDGEWVKLLNWMFWGMCGMGLTGILYIILKKGKVFSHQPLSDDIEKPHSP